MKLLSSLTRGPTKAAEVTPVKPVPEEVDNANNEEAGPTDGGDNPNEGDKPNDNPDGRALSSPERMYVPDNDADHGVGSAMEDSDSNNDMITVAGGDSKDDAIEKHRKAVLSGEEMAVSSDSDSEDRNAMTRDQLLIVTNKLDKSDRWGKGKGQRKSSTKRDRQHDSGCGKTSNGGPANVTPLLGDGQSWSIPHYQARPPGLYGVLECPRRTGG